ncbi:hypothetical protein MBVG596_1073 [Mycoplasmopsis bovigenitalium]|uniref:HNH endonuclease n=1 Tax=Mycoplasmopsis bovigenitalium TaxID=2112 RepID=UPI000909CEBF|nr:HNH endonuclease signature motif containing protein [Mycoplasmopsis bovigenitalium]BAW18551.1 hypothetical protein MBVG596_1073 [Mycoplasmopsis bovigenitalium]
MINWKYPYNSKRWIALRDKHLWKQPYCVKCETTFNLQVDHIISHRNNENLFLDPENLQTLCIQHHSEKTNQTKGLIFFKRSNLPLKINTGVAGGINLHLDQFIKLQAHYFTNYATHCEFNIKQNNLNYKELQTLVNLVLEFFKIKGLVFENIQSNESQVVELFNNLLAE